MNAVKFVGLDREYACGSCGCLLVSRAVPDPAERFCFECKPVPPAETSTRAVSEVDPIAELARLRNALQHIVWSMEHETGGRTDRGEQDAHRVGLALGIAERALDGSWRARPVVR